jgi:hypothetical protein
MGRWSVAEDESPSELSLVPRVAVIGRDAAEAAFAPLIERGRAAGVVQPDVDTADVLLALSMAAAGIADRAAAGDEHPDARVRRLLHRALFTPAY